jgi:putative ABC transport system permease protein
VLTLAWRGVRFNIGRYVATLVAILTGVGFFAASGFLSDRVIEALEGTVDQQFGAIEVAVIPDPAQSATAASRLRISVDLAEEIEALPEVGAVAGDLSGSLAFLADDGEVVADGAVGRIWVVDDRLNPLDIAEGTAPVAADEIAVDRGLAADEGFTVGDRVTLLSLAGQTEMVISGITSFGDNDAIDGSGTVSLPAANAFDLLNRGQREYDALFVRGDGGSTVVAEAVKTVVPDGFMVLNGDDFRDDKRSEVGGIGRILKRGLQFFALLALMVGGFVIYNTFNVIVAQRTRELAVLAAIGATPKQLKRSLRWEALVIGVVGSALGVLAGFAMAFGLMAVLDRMGVSLPGSGVSVRTSTIVLAALFGIVITFVSAMLPASRAGRAEPLEALRQADAATVTIGRGRMTGAGIAIAAGGLGMFVLSDARLIGLCALVLFGGVISAGPVIAVLGSALMRPLLAPFGLEGRLAADNTARNPHRTAATSNALLIGVFLVTFVSIAGTSAKDYAVAQINALSTADYTIESDGGTIDPELVASLEAIEGVELVTPFRREAVGLSVDGTDQGASTLSSGDLDALVDAAGIELKSGSLDDVVPGTVVLLDSQSGGAGVGSTAVFTNSSGEQIELEVVGIIGLNLDAMATGNITDPSTFDEFVGETAPTVAFIKTVRGAQSDTADAIEALTKLRPDISLQAGNFLGRLIGTIFDFLINAVNGLLLMSVVIALIGIVNTMTLSILERRRELGLLRVVGMIDRRVRRMVRLESVVIASLGTISGMLLGAFGGFALITAIRRESDADIALRLPPGLLAVILVVGVFLGLVAALIPAQRSTRLDVLESIQST